MSLIILYFTKHPMFLAEEQGNSMITRHDFSKHRAVFPQVFRMFLKSR